MRELAGVAVLLGSIAAGGMAFAWPWLPRDSAATASLAAYFPVSDGRAALSAKYGPDGALHSWESQNQQVLRPGRALAGELRKAEVEALKKLFLRPGEEELGETELLGRLQAQGVTLVRSVSRELKDGSVKTNVSFSIRDRRGEHLLGFYDVANDRDLTFEPAVLSAPADLSAGKTWESRGKLMGVVDYTFSGRVLEAAPFRGRAGSFRDCRRLETRFVLANAGSVVSDERWNGWYCAGVGLVQEETRDAAGTLTGRRLTVAAEGMPTLPGLFPPALPATAAPAAPAAPGAGEWELTRVARIGQMVNSTESTIPPVWIPGEPAALLVAGAGSDLTAYDASDPTGTILWRFHPGGTVYSPPAYDARTGRIFFGATDKRLYALDARGLFLWSFRTGDNVATRPVVVGKVVVFGSEDRVIYGVDAATGKLLWRRITGGPVVSSPAVVGGTVVVGSDDGTLYALDARTGRELWTHAADDAVEAPVVAEGGVVYAVGRDGELRALDPATGKARWTARVGNVVRAAPAVGPQAVYVVDYYGWLKAFDRATGRRLWVAPEDRYTGPAVVVGGDVYVPRADGTVHRISADGKKVREWKSGGGAPGETGAGFHLGITTGGGALWLADNSAYVWRLGAGTGGARPLALAWSRMVSEKPFAMSLLTGTPLVQGGKLFLLDRSNFLYEVDPATGSAVRRGQAAPGERSAMLDPVAAGSTLLVPVGGTLHAARLPDGAPLWKYEGGGMALRPAVAADGTVLWTTQAGGGSSGKQSGTLHALDLATGRLRWSAPIAGVGAVGGVEVRGGVVYLATPASAFDLATGRRLWAGRSPEPALGGPALSARGDVLYTGALSPDGEVGSISALGTADGRPRWRTALAGGETLTIMERIWTAGDLLVVPALSGRVIGLDAATGEERWRYTPEAPRMGAVTVDGGRVFLALQNGQVVVLDAATGRPTARFSDLELSLSSFSYAQRPIRVGDRLVVASGITLLGFRLP